MITHGNGVGSASASEGLGETANVYVNSRDKNGRNYE